MARPARSDERDPVTVLLIHRRSTLRNALRLLLDGGAGITVVAESGDPRDLAAAGWPDAQVAVWDAGTLGDAWLAGLTGPAPPAPASALLVLAETATVGEVEQWLRAGADGCVLTTDAPDSLALAVRALARGEAWLSPPVARRVLDLYRPVAGLAPPPDDRLSVLSAREREVLRLISAGRSNAEIAVLLTVSGATVKTHVSRILGKLGVRDRVQASAVAHRSGLLRTLP